MRHIITLPILLGLFTACAPKVTELDTQRQTWADRGSDSYAITVQQSCFCPDTNPIRVVVTDGAITSAIRQPADPSTAEPTEIPAAEYEDWFTVEGLFAAAEDALRDADEVSITYDADAGYPSAIEIDWMRDAIDDERSFSAFDLELDPQTEADSLPGA